MSAAALSVALTFFRFEEAKNDRKEIECFKKREFFLIDAKYLGKWENDEKERRGWKAALF